jgi:hypothetical protein
MTLEQLRLKHWSTYIAFVVWGTAGYGFTPNLGTLFVHLLLIPPLLALLVWCSHYEGRWS